MQEQFDYIEDNEEEEKEKDTSNMDDDLKQYFSDARISFKPSSVTDKPKKQKNIKIYNIGDTVTYRNKPAVIIFGPYEKNYKYFYEIQTHDNKIIAATTQALT